MKSTAVEELKCKYTSKNMAKGTQSTAIKRTRELPSIHLHTLAAEFRCPHAGMHDVPGLDELVRLANTPYY